VQVLGLVAIFQQHIFTKHESEKWLILIIHFFKFVLKRVPLRIILLLGSVLLILPLQVDHMAILALDLLVPDLAIILIVVL
jgi:hypothetical protein